MQFYLISQFSLAETITASMPATAVAGRMMFSESWHRLRNERHYNVLQMFCKNTLTTWYNNFRTEHCDCISLLNRWYPPFKVCGFLASTSIFEPVYTSISVKLLQLSLHTCTCSVSGQTGYKLVGGFSRNIIQHLLYNSDCKVRTSWFYLLFIALNWVCLGLSDRIRHQCSVFLCLGDQNCWTWRSSLHAFCMLRGAEEGLISSILCFGCLLFIKVITANHRGEIYTCSPA